MNCLRRDYPRELVPVILAPILYQEEQAVEYTSQKMAHEGINNLNKNIVETSIADLILETGYSFTASIEECRTRLAAFGVREISPASVARAISYMACTHSGLDENSIRHLRNGTSPAWPEQEQVADKNNDGSPSTWNMDTFVQVLRTYTFSKLLT